MVSGPNSPPPPNNNNSNDDGRQQENERWAERSAGVDEPHCGFLVPESLDVVSCCTGFESREGRAHRSTNKSKVVLNRPDMGRT